MPDTLQSIAETPSGTGHCSHAPPQGPGSCGWVPVSLSDTEGRPGQSLHPRECCGTILTAGPGGPTGPAGPAVPSLPGKPIKPWQGKSREWAGAVDGRQWGWQGSHGHCTRVWGHQDQ